MNFRTSNRGNFDMSPSSEVPSNSDFERHSVAVQETEQWVGLCLVPVRFRTYDEYRSREEVSQCQQLDRYRRARRVAETGVPTNQKIQRTVERIQVRVHRDMYRSSRSSRRLLRHHKLSRENADHLEDPEDC